MLKDYYAWDRTDMNEEKYKRLLSVQAALEIAKASAMSSDASAHCRVDEDLKNTAAHIEVLASAIRKSLEIKTEE